jgi:hypothetical protein
MASNTLDLKWEWPAGRPIESALLVRVESIQPASRGLFGMRASPSMADALPDATELKARVDEQSTRLAGQDLLIRLPGIEAQKLKAGQWAALGLVESGTVCACVAAAPTQSVEEARRWLATSPCR